MKEYALGLYEKAMPKDLSWEEKLMAAKEGGFDFVEISIDETDEKLARLDMTTEEREKLMEIMKKTGVPIRSMCLSGHRKYPFGSSDAVTEAKSLEIMEKAVALAENLGIRIIQLAGYDVYYEESTEETRRRFEGNLKKAVAMAARAGVILGFETMENDFMNTVEKAMKYVNIIDSPYLNVYPDSGNITNAAKLYGTDVLTDMETGRGHMVAVHLKETVPGKFREIPFGTGHVDFDAIIDKAWKLGVRRFVTEFWYVGGETWMEDLKSANRMMSRIFEKNEENYESDYGDV